MAIWAADVCSRAARQLICIEPTGLRLKHTGKTDPQCGTVQFCFRSGRLTCSARTGFRAITTPLASWMYILVEDGPDDGVSVDVRVVEERVEIRQQRVAQQHRITHHSLRSRVKTARILHSNTQSASCPLTSSE